MTKELIWLFPLAGICMTVQEAGGTAKKTKADKKHPNIVLIYADDLGFGDISVNGATEIKTPGIDRIGNEGLCFNNAYATSATSTPSRFAMLTGCYPWRVGAQVLQGNAPLIIREDMPTYPKMLQKAGYVTGAVGKWHLGLGNGNVNWNKEVTPGAKDVGFDYSFITAATNDRVPSVFIENGRVANLDPNDPIEVNYTKNFPGEPTGKDNPELLKIYPSHGHNNSITNGISRIGYMRGGKSALWVDENMADTFLAKATAFVTEHKDRPFFLYYALHQPHVPRVPNPRFAGKSSMGPRGDVILEADWCVGEFLKTLDKLGLSENTIVIFSSDNGPVLDDGYQDYAIAKLGNHKPAGPLRGGKYSLYEGGTHVPLMVRWPLEVKRGRSDALVCQMDFYASLAKLVGQKNESKDSQNHLDAFLGRTQKGRKEIVLEGTGKNIVYLRKEWAFIPPMVSWGYCVAETESGQTKEPQLFNLKKDPGQQENLAGRLPQKVQKMMDKLVSIRGEWRK